MIVEGCQSDSNLIQLSDFVGEHGPYQMMLTIILFMRYLFLGLMANSGPLMTPDVTYYCSLPMDEIVAIMPNITLLNQTEQDIEIREEFKRICQIDLHLYQEAYLNYTLQQQQQFSMKSNESIKAQQDRLLWFNGHRRHVFNESDKIRECTDFTYDSAPELGRTMTSEFDLICDRDYLRSIFQSIISASIVVAHVFWGTFSDKYGRFTAQKYCLTISLLAGSLSIFAMDFWTFTICRALCSFGDLGLAVSLTTTVVELVGNNYRGLSVAWVNFGSALGVTMFPYIVAYFQDFKLVITFTVVCNLATLPFFVFTTNESIRWLLTNRKFHSAKKELKRLIRSNKRYYRLLSIILWPLKNKNYFKPHIVGFNRNQHQCAGAGGMETSGGGCGGDCGGGQGGGGDELNKKKKEEGGGAGEKEEERKISWLEEKQAFEMLFKNFIDQIESQNICDPLGPTSFQLESPSVTSGFAADLATEQTDVLMMAAATGGNQSQRNRLSIGSMLGNLNEINKQPSDINNNNNPSIQALQPMQEVLADFEPVEIQNKLAETGRASISRVPSLTDANSNLNSNEKQQSFLAANLDNSELQFKLNELCEKMEVEEEEKEQQFEIELPEIMIEEYSTTTENFIDIDLNSNFKLNRKKINSMQMDGVDYNQIDSSSSGGGSSSQSIESGGKSQEEEKNKYDWYHLRAPYSRADSCGHLDKNINERRCHFLLTIPANDPSSMLNISQDFRDARFVRRRGQQQPDCINLVASQLSFVGRVNRVFRDKQLMLVVFTIVWTTFNSELQYTSFIIINMEVGEDVKWNYFLGGCMEFSAAIIASLLLSIGSRRHTLIIFWLLISFFCFGLSVAHIDSTWAVLLLALAKFSQSCLSSIASVAAFESFPTFLRQSGSGLVSTLGMLGSVFAPLIFAEFDDHAGMDRVLMTFSFLSLTAAILIFKFLRETKNCELN